MGVPKVCLHIGHLIPAACGLNWLQEVGIEFDSGGLVDEI